MRDITMVFSAVDAVDAQDWPEVFVSSETSLYYLALMLSQKWT